MSKNYINTNRKVKYSNLIGKLVSRTFERQPYGVYIHPSRKQRNIGIINKAESCLSPAVCVQHALSCRRDASCPIGPIELLFVVSNDNYGADLCENLTVKRKF
jgi:hypothetical protein